MTQGPCYYRGDLIAAPVQWNLDLDWDYPFGFRAGVEEVLKSEDQLIPFHTSAAPLLLLSGLEDTPARGETRIINYTITVSSLLRYGSYHGRESKGGW